MEQKSITWETDEDNVKWAIDKDNNRCSVSWFGSEKEALKALGSLENCNDCRNCNYCNYCNYCTHCTHCTHCNDCRNCNHCNDCNDCNYCNYFNECRNCNGSEKEEKPLKIPTIDKIHQKVLKSASKEGGLKMDSWHTCNTTHCRAGWAIHLAGEKGYELEKRLGTPLAALKIYRENSDLEVHMPDFYKTNKETMEDMKR